MLSIFIGFLINLIISNYYGAKELGVYAIVNSLLTIVLLFSILGTNSSVLRLIPEYISKYSYLSAYKLFWKIFRMVFIASIVVSVLIAFSADYIAISILHKEVLIPVILLMVWFIPFHSLEILMLASIRALRHIKMYAILQIVGPITQIMILLILTFVHFQENNSVYALFISYVIVFVIALLLLLKYFKTKIDIKSTIVIPSTFSILSLSLPMMLTITMGIIISQTDILMLGAMSSMEEVGVYAIVVKLALLTVFVLNSVNVSIAPKISELYFADKIDELKSLVKKTTKLVVIVSFLPVLILILFGESILGFFGKEFVLGYTALVLFILGQIASVLAGPVEFLLNMTGHQKAVTLIVMFAALLNIILNYILIPMYGIEGAAAASMVSLIVSKSISSIYIVNKFGFNMGYLVPYTKG